MPGFCADSLIFVGATPKIYLAVKMKEDAATAAFELLDDKNSLTNNVVWGFEEDSPSHTRWCISEEEDTCQSIGQIPRLQSMASAVTVREITYGRNTINRNGTLILKIVLWNPREGNMKTGGDLVMLLPVHDLIQNFKSKSKSIPSSVV